MFPTNLLFLGVVGCNEKTPPPPPPGTCKVRGVCLNEVSKTPPVFGWVVKPSRMGNHRMTWLNFIVFMQVNIYARPHGWVMGYLVAHGS